MTSLPSLLYPDSPAELLEEIETAALIRLYRRKSVDIGRFLSGLERIGLYRCTRTGVKFFHPVVPGDAEFYAALSRHPWYYDAAKYEFSAVAETVEDGCRILDVGCGSGKFAAMVPQARYTGLEFTPSAADEGTARGLEIFVESVEAHCRRRPGHYDMVVAFQVLEHVTNPLEFLLACREALRPGGVLVISVPNDDAFQGICVNDALNMPPHHLTRWTEAALGAVFADIGLHDMKARMEPLQSYHRIWFMRQFFLRALHQRLRGRAPASIGEGPVFGALHLAAHALALFFQPALPDGKMIAVGHTIIASATRPAASLQQPAIGESADQRQPVQA